MSDPEENSSLSSYTGLRILAVVLPLVVIFKHLGTVDAGLNIGLCLGMSILAAMMRWRLRRHIWFWTALAVVLAIQLVFAVRIPWPHWWVSGTVLLPFGLASLGLSLGGIALAEKAFGKPEPDDDDSQDSEGTGLNLEGR